MLTGGKGMVWARCGCLACGKRRQAAKTGEHARHSGQTFRGSRRFQSVQSRNAHGWRPADGKWGRGRRGVTSCVRWHCFATRPHRCTLVQIRHAAGKEEQQMQHTASCAGESRRRRSSGPWCVGRPRRGEAGREAGHLAERDRDARRGVNWVWPGQKPPPPQGHSTHTRQLSTTRPRHHRLWPRGALPPALPRWLPFVSPSLHTSRVFRKFFADGPIRKRISCITFRRFVDVGRTQVV